MRLNPYWVLLAVCIWIVFCLVLVEQLVWNQVHGDYTEYLGVRIESEKPDICITEPEDPKIDFWNRGLFNATLSALVEWEWKLNQTGKNFDMKYHLLLNKTHFDKSVADFKWCDVFLVYERVTDDKTLGFTSFHFNDSRHKYSMIVIYTSAFEQRSVIDIGKKEIIQQTKYLNFSQSFVNRVVKHEFGHALGLDHQIKTIEDNYNSIMKPHLTNKNELTHHDIEAVLKLYPNGFQRFYNYLTPERYIP